MDDSFEDLLAANRIFAEGFGLGGMEGRAAAGLAIVTCMDSRIDPLAILGLRTGDAKVVRNPGGRVTDQAIEALVLAVHLLGAERIMVIPHTRCAMSSATLEEVRRRVGESAGQDVSWQDFGMVDHQEQALLDDVRKLRTHPLIPGTVGVGGFVYDVDTGRLERHS